MINEHIKQKFASLKQKNDIVVLGIESSCDETASSVVRGFDVLSNVVASQIDIHREFGGVVPEVASRNHTLNIIPVIDQALKQANVTLSNIDAIAVTAYPGLIGSLLVGVSASKALSMAHNIPLIQCNHIQSHICVNYLNPQIKPPFLAVCASGGHTSIIKVSGYNQYTTLAYTCDDAIGEAFDKVGRLLGLDYPAGSQVDKLSKHGQDNIVFMRTKANTKQENGKYLISYSGLKTAVVNYINNKKQRGEQILVNDICASFSKMAVDILVQTLNEVVQDCGLKTVAFCGGVASNSLLRSVCGSSSHFNAFFPLPSLCTDNAVMVALQGFLSAREGKNLVGLDLNARSCYE